MPRKPKAEDLPGVPLQTVWTDIPPLHNLAAERLGYPTQKPVALLERIIKASSNPNDFEFENWAVIALGGIPNKAQVGDHGIDGRIYPVSSVPRKTGQAVGELAFMDVWYPIQVKQKDKAGRPDIDSFEAVLTREDRTKSYHAHP